MLGEPLVEKCVVGIQQVEDAAILAHDAFEKQLRLELERLPEVVVVVKQGFRTRLVPVDIADVKPLAGEIVHQRLRTRIREHPAHLLLQHFGLAQVVLLGYL